MATRSLCSIPNCDKPVHLRGWCSAHYQRWRKHGDPLGGAQYQRTHKAGDPCSVGDCNRPARTKGLCHSHYERLRRTGDPSSLPDPIKPLGEALEWLISHVAHEGTECLLWPFTCDEAGYGRVFFNGRTDRAHRVMCTLAHGEPPQPDLDAAHSCGNGFGGCIHPKHLRWATRLDNIQDEIDHGTFARGEKKPNAILTEEAVRAIRSLQGAVSVRRMADQFGVSIQTIYAVLSKRNWHWLD